LLDGPGGSGVPAEIEAMLYEIVVSCEWRQDAKGAAHAHALKGTALEGGSDSLWRMRFGLELDMNRPDAVVTTVEAMTGGRGAALNAIPVSSMWQASLQLKDLGKADLRARLLQLLAGDGYAPDELLGSNEAFRYDYAELLADSGKAEASRPIIAGLQSASLLAQASVDPRFRAFLPAEVDFRAVAEAELARDKDIMSFHPDRLYALVVVARDLRRLGRPQEAVDLLLAAAPKVADAETFKDLVDTRNWYWDSLARSYHMLGQYDALVEAFRKGAGAGEGGSPNVSQVINLAEAQNSFGHGDEALRTLAVFSDGRKSSPFGEMEMRFARGCAHAVAGHPEAAAEDLAFARAHEKDHPEALADMLVCLGDLDGAAAAFIRRLDDPERRAGALLQLSDYDDPVVALPPDPLHSRLAALKARADVKGAIERAGGARRFRLQRGEL
jgi:tetratricopeptide (TPR) repeat protein